MAQKDKIKELVGRSLNSYHTKSLQQIHRIEKKNKEQNHKISILSNELDNDYLTKTEEGSVISLEHSKEGMVYLDELQGNTLVNYCTDGSKEMTLNGDIDVEGTFVTTTEGVDNGKVDVICEGNTLVNKLYKIKNYGSITEFLNHGWNSGVANCNRYEWLDNGIKIYSTLEDTSTDRYYRSTPEKYGIFKKNRTYIVRMNVNSDNFEINATILRCFYGNGRVFMAGTLSEVKNGVFVKKATTSSEIEECDAIHSMISLDYIRALNTEGWVSFQNVMVIDVTDLPSYQQDVEYWRNIEYFEGMKSVGQDDENGHKIEILSQRNLADIATSGDTNFKVANIKMGKTYSIKSTRNDSSVGYNLLLQKNDGTNIQILVGGAYNDFYTFSPNQDGILFFNSYGVTQISDIMLVEGVHTQSTMPSFKPYQYNKKEILLNEPLRGLPSGVKDRLVRIGGKWYIERNCGEIILDGSEEDWVSICAFSKTNVFRKPLLVAKNTITDYGTVVNNFLVDKLPIVKYSTYDTIDAQTVSFSSLFNSTYNGTAIYINRNSSSDLVSFKQWLSENPITVIYELVTPIYEPLAIEPTLNTYNDITHISNNSIIPCNMKIKNTGYNAIIKPSTLYTVALDTNKSGTIGMNLGGAKGTTTNNVLKLTTPATLTDDSLRLYGKGIKGSKVRLFEGDKTNWIPSFFEGMKSSFEDKLQDDGSYKMEILSNNKNLFDIDAEYYKAGWGNQNYQRNGNGFSFDAMDGWSSIGYEVKGHRDKTVVISATVTCINKDTSKSREQSLRVHTETWSGANGTSFLDGETKRIKFNVKLNHEGRVYFNGSSTPEGSSNGGVKWTVKDILIEDVDGGTGYFPRECNKIQFSSIEPLRSVNKNIRDKFIFKDGKLMIERNCVQRVMENKNWSLNKTVESTKAIQFTNGVMMKSIGAYAKSQEVLCNKKPTLQNDGGKNSIWVYDYQTLVMQMDNNLIKTREDFGDWIESENPIITLPLKEPTYEEIPFELQKIILEGYENGTLFFDTNIPPTSTVTYAGETPILKATKLNKTEVLNNTNDINDNIIPYLMDMDYRVVCLQLQSENINDGVSMARLFGGTYEMLQRDIQSKRYSVDEYRHRLDAYLDANKITEEEYNKLGDMLNE